MDPNMPAALRALQFFRACHIEFTAILAGARDPHCVPDTLLDAAFSLFETESAQQSTGAAPLACHKGCATCCALRVTATAPEVLRIARYLRGSCSAQACVRLVRRLLEADGFTRDLDEAARVALRQRCPFIEKGACVIYAVRPLACRGHASHSRRACVDAMAGRPVEVPYSVGHRTARSLVQNALQSALRDAGLAWASYELNHALRIALGHVASETAWLGGEDLFAEAAVLEVSPAEMVAGFERIKRLA